MCPPDSICHNDCAWALQLFIDVEIPKNPLYLLCVNRIHLIELGLFGPARCKEVDNIGDSRSSARLVTSRDWGYVAGNQAGMGWR